MEGGAPRGQGRRSSALSRLPLLRRVGQGRLQRLRRAFRQALDRPAHERLRFKIQSGRQFPKWRFQSDMAWECCPPKLK